MKLSLSDANDAPRLREEQAVSLSFKGLELCNDSPLGLSDHPDCRIDGGNDEEGTLAGGEESV